MPRITVSYRRRGSLDQDKFGEITPADERHKPYFKLLRQMITNTYVQMIVPGGS